MTEIALHVQDLAKTYPNGVQAVAGISFEVFRGEILALLGPNGSGKTTTVKMVAGLVLPSSGSAEIMGLNVLKHRTDAMRHLGAVLEGARNVYWQLSARENLRYFGGLRGVPKRQLEKRIDELLLDVGLLAEQDRPVGQFSRGMQQKLAIAAALLHDPEVLLLDEPTLGLDVSAARALEDNIARLASERGKSVLLTTHTMPLAEKLAHRVLVIRRGQKVAYDTTAKLLAEHNSHVDYTEVLVTGEMSLAVLSALREAFPHVEAGHVNGNTELTWKDAQQSEVLSLLHWLDGHDLAIGNVGHRQPTLEEVFMTLTQDTN